MSSKMLDSKNVQDAVISGRGLGVIVHQCEPLHLAIGGGQSTYNCSRERPHAKPQGKFTALVPVLPQLGQADTSRIAQVNFVLAATCDYVSVEIPSTF
jgi:hypothetical protein